MANLAPDTDRIQTGGEQKLVHAGAVQAAAEPGVRAGRLHEPVPGMAVGGVGAWRRQPVHLRRHPRQLGRLWGPVLTSSLLLAAANCSRHFLPATGIHTNGQLAKVSVIHRTVYE